MSWPTNVDYQTAIQNPGLCFDDVELRRGHAQTDKHGLPQPFSGNFASVYKVNCGNRTYAVRCFLREFADQRDRYERISAHLKAKPLPCMFDFSFLENGIRLKGRWYPILKMEWVQGELLHDFVKRSLGSPRQCSELAREWLELCKSLKHAGIAHGDFQHGNILVVQGQFKLIDYDGMFVPALGDRQSHEVGHPNYQHPHRDSSHFGPFLDNFSAWVIYVSLVALSSDPTLWQSTGAGDECLLFRQEDFREPYASRVFVALERDSDVHIQNLALTFRNLVFLEPDQVPGLDSQTAEPCTPPAHDGTWVLDFVSGADSSVAAVRFPAALAQLRTLVFGSLVLVLGLGLPLLRSQELSNQLLWALFVGLSFAVNVLVFRSRYRRDPAVHAWQMFEVSFDAEKRSAKERKASLEAVQTKRQSVRNEEAEKRRILQSQIDESRRSEARDVNNVQAELKRRLSDIARSRQQIEAERDSALNNIRSECQGEIKRLEKGIASMPQVESQELANALGQLQHRHILDHLRRQKTCYAGIKGMTSYTRASLFRRFPTAADIDYREIQGVWGIGRKRALALSGWRSQHESLAKRTMPKSLPPMTEASIRSACSCNREGLIQER